MSLHDETFYLISLCGYKQTIWELLRSKRFNKTRQDSRLFEIKRRSMEGTKLCGSSVVVAMFISQCFKRTFTGCV
jgi:hypothetical protein